MRKHKLKLGYLLSVFVLALTTLIPIFIFNGQSYAITSADGGSTTAKIPSLTDRAFTWSLISYYTGGGEYCSIKGFLDDPTINSQTGGGDTHSIGMHVEHIDGRMNCKEAFGAVANSASMWGYADVNALFSGISNGDYAKYLISRIPMSFFTNGSKTEPSEDVLYYIYNTNFAEGCQAWDSNGGTNGEKINLGYGIAFGNIDNKEDDGKETCREMYDWIQANPDAKTAYEATLAAEKANPDGYTNGSSPSSGSSNVGDTCFSTVTFWGWLACPFLEMADGVIGWSTSAIESLMTISPELYNNTSGQGGLKTIWSSVRILSTIALVGIALFMVISQMLSLDMVSAYTIKKLMPKLVAATILMQLSWFLATSMIEVFNVIGSAVKELIYAPFGGHVGDIGSIMQTYARNVSWDSELLASGTTTVAILLAGVGIIGSTGPLFALLALAVGVVMAVVVAIVTLVIRKILIISLLIIAPLAIVAWILPNTQKYWQMWSSNFMKMLMLFPIFTGFMAIGRAFAQMIANNPGDSDYINYFVILIAYFGPLFMLPKIFQMGGTLMTAMASGINKYGTMARRGIMSSKPASNLKTSHQEAKMIAGTTRAASGKNKYVRAFGRWQTGRTWATGQYGERLAQQGVEQDRRNAAEELNHATYGLTPDELKEERRKIAKAKDGDTITVNGKQIKVTRRLQNANALFSLRERNHTATDLYMDSLEGDKAGQKSFRDFIQANYADFDALAPDITRGDRWFDKNGNKAGGMLRIKDDGTFDSKSLKPAVAHYDDMGGMQQEGVWNSIMHLNESEFAEEKQEVAGHLAMLASVNMKEADRVKLAQELYKRGITEQPFDFNDVRLSGGKKRFVAYTDPATGRQKIKIENVDQNNNGNVNQPPVTH